MRRRALPLLLVILLTRPAVAEPVPLGEAEVRGQALHRVLKRPRAENGELARALASVEEAYVQLVMDAEPTEGNVDRWRQDQQKRMERFRTRAEKSFLKALALKRVDRERGVNLRHPIQFQAARALGRTRPCAAEGFRRVLEKDVFGDRDYPKERSFYDVALRALAALDDPKTFDWLLERAVNADVNDESKHRALAALEVMMDAVHVTPEQRRLTVRRLIDIYQSYAFHWQNKYDAVAGFRSGSRKYVKIAGVQGTYWMDVRPVVLRALRHFSRDPRTGLPPLDPKTGREWETLPEWLNWYHRVGRRGMPPWIDAERRDATGSKNRARLGHQAPLLSEYERAFGVPWQRWWAGHARPPLRTRAGGSTAVLTGPDAGPRAAFVRGMRHERLPALFVAALDDPHPEIRAAAALGLGKTRAPLAKEALTNHLADEPHERVREAAVLGLLCLRDPSLADAFQDLLHDPEENARIRAYAVLALGYLGEGTSVWALLGERRPALEASSAVMTDLQAMAVVAAGLSGEPALAPGLMDVLASGRWSPAVRGQVGVALARLGNREVVPGLLRMVRTSCKDEDDVLLCAAAASALGVLVKPDDKGSIRRLAAPVLAPKGKFGGSRNALALALGAVGGPEAEKALTAAWEKRAKDTTRVAELGFLLIALADLETTTASALVRHQLRTLEHEHDLAAAALGAARVGDRLATAVIRDRVRSSEHILTAYGLVALGMLGDADVGSIARERLEESHEPQLVRRALTALALAEGENALTDLDRWWGWSRSHAHLDALAWAFAVAPSPGAEAFLTGVAAEATGDPRRRAYALIALGRMVDADPFLARVGRDANPYVEPPTLSLLHRYADVPFFRE